MHALVVLLQVLMSASGIALCPLLLMRARQEKSPSSKILAWAYVLISFLMLLDAALLAIYQLEELRTMILVQPSLGSTILELVLIAKSLGRIALVFLAMALFRGLKLPLRPWWWVLVSLWALFYVAITTNAFSLPNDLLMTIAFDALPIYLWAFGGIIMQRQKVNPFDWQLGKVAPVILLSLLGLYLGKMILVDVAIITPAMGLWLNLTCYLILNGILYKTLLGPRARPDQKLTEIAGLSPREQEVAQHLISMASYKEIAEALSISTETVKSHAKSIYRKSDCASRVDLMKRYHP